MTYQVIARKWRPQTFEEVTGQEHVTRTLRNAVEHDRLHHAYIFSGARGVGKTSTARLFAKALNCHKSDHPTPSFCRTDDDDICPSCREIAEGRSIDVQEIDAASTTGVQNVRDSIIDTIGIAPARDRYKVFIIDEVHMLSTPAFNALLKTLEEPPPRVVFIMATTEAHKLLSTIVSRCQQFEFRTIATAKIAERLRFIAAAENIDVTDEALREIARAGEGSMRDAQSALDQIISFAGSKIAGEDVGAALGIAGVDILGRVIAAIAEANPSSVLAVVDDLVMRGHDLRNFCRDLMAYLRDLLIAKVAGDAAGALDLSEAEHNEFAKRAVSFTESDLIRFFHSLTETELTLRDAAHPRYQLEIGLLKLIEMRRLTPLQNIIDRLNSLEGSNLSDQTLVNEASVPLSKKGSKSLQEHSTHGAGEARSASDVIPTAALTQDESFEVDDSLFKSIEGVLTPLSERTSPPAPTRKSASDKARHSPASSQLVPAEDPSIDANAAPAGGSIIENIKAALEKRKRMFLVTALDAARKVGMEGEELIVEFTPEARHLRDNLAKPDNVKLLREVCRDLLGHEIAIRISIEERGDETDGAPISREDDERLDKKRMRKNAEQNPAVQQLLQTFHGEIVDVRRVEKETPSTIKEPE
jgi:DNA polymerase-3 subunit gamma/tau